MPKVAFAKEFGLVYCTIKYKSDINYDIHISIKSKYVCKHIGKYIIKLLIIYICILLLVYY